MKDLSAQPKAHYGSRSDPAKDPLVREAEELIGVELDLENEDQEESWSHSDFSCRRDKGQVADVSSAFLSSDIWDTPPSERYSGSNLPLG